jgi:hypothetical protein
LDETIWSLTSPRANRISGSRNFRSLCQKDFFNNIGAKRSFGEPTITLEAKAWLTSLSCRKAKELGYPHELWTTRLLARHAREHGPAEGHPCLANTKMAIA